MSRFACVDASVAAKWVLPEEYSDRSLGLYEHCRRSGITIAAPPHMAVEVTNAIRRRVTRRFITYAEGRDLVTTFTQFSVRLVIPAGLYQEAFDLAQTFNRPTVYDAHYVALARTLGCVLWTADEALLNALGGKLPFVRWIRDYVGVGG
ncbi:MAG: PIN domain-containing protein [Chloroflexota bacterium]|nr:MAG: PIN domain-containing protein [Chloroflexota bacterium]